MNNRAEAFKKKALQYERAANVATDADACRQALNARRLFRRSLGRDFLFSRSSQIN